MRIQELLNRRAEQMKKQKTQEKLKKVGALKRSNLNVYELIESFKYLK